jgi:glycosyltransferase involved in cell wall biosynthesis
MQGAQTESRFRGIGRYTLSFAQALVRNRGEHEVILALNGLFPDTIEPIRAGFGGLLPQENIRVWHTPGPVLDELPDNEDRREVAEHVREAFLASLAPDVIHISSLFEGYVDNAISSIGRFDLVTPVSVSLYDLIPMLNSDHYLKQNSRFAKYYERKVGYLKQAAFYLAISEFSKQEGMEHLDGSMGQIVNVSTAVESHFQPLSIDGATAARLHKKLGIACPFVLYTGGADKRKNLPRLIQAFAGLPATLRAGHQLLIAGKMTDADTAELTRVAKTAGLGPGELCFAGYVTDNELIQLYNLCKLYVFPSWHEGFGLPALEAMACGAPVIGADTSSLPEVIGLDVALFDPFDVASITAKMAYALDDEEFCSALCKHGLQQANRFSWDESAKRAFVAWESLDWKQKIPSSYIDLSLRREKLIQSLAQYLPEPDEAELTALAACLAQNQNTGLERQLILDVSELVQRDAATGVQRVVRSYLKALLQSPPDGFIVEPVYATLKEGYVYARRFTQYFLGQGAEHLIDKPLQWQRGDVFFGLDMQHHVQLTHKAFYRQLRLDGVIVKFLIYDLLPIQLAELFKDSDAKNLHEEWLGMIANTDGAICISRSTTDAYDAWLAENAIQRTPNFQLAWVHIGSDIDNSNSSKGMPVGAQEVLDCVRRRPSFLCVATLEPRKGQQQIVDALMLLWNEGLDINLVLVGQQGWKIEALVETLRNHTEKGTRLFWLRGISDEYLEKVYSASTCLIAASINEGFGLPLIEAARHKTPIIARDIPVFREVAGDHAFYFTGESAYDLASALKAWLGMYQANQHPKSNQLRCSTWQESTENLKLALVRENYSRKQLIVDISELVQHDAKSGIQRVVRSILKEWLSHPPDGYRVEPVYATVEQGYLYARRFTQFFLGLPGEDCQDEPIEYEPGDFFIGLDFQPQVVAAQRNFYQTLRRQGVRVKFVVYDLLCVLMPQYFPHGTMGGFSRWLDAVAESDGALCISKAVAVELAHWVDENAEEHHRPFRIDWFRLGADVDNSMPTKGLPGDADPGLEQLIRRQSFLMVGTLEPRKGHGQVLEAFEKLWQSGVDVNLVIVGNQGWLMERFIDRIRAHPELNKRLFWHEGISDEYLVKIYASSTCLIMASYGEGFGLPLVEAAQHNLPIIARDIPVFREVAGEHAFYFNANAPDEYAQAIQKWLALYEKEMHPVSADMPWLTWEESAKNLFQKLL